MALEAEFAARGVRVHDSIPWEVVAPLMAATGIYSKTFLETLAMHNAEALLDAVHARKKGKTIAFLVAADGDAIAKFVVRGDLPDTARLALDDLDVAGEALRGKILRWDAKAMTWHADNAEGWAGQQSGPAPVHRGRAIASRCKASYLISARSHLPGAWMATRWCGSCAELVPCVTIR